MFDLRQRTSTLLKILTTDPEQVLKLGRERYTPILTTKAILKTVLGTGNYQLVANY